MIDPLNVLMTSTSHRDMVQMKATVPYEAKPLPGPSGDSSKISNSSAKKLPEVERAHSDESSGEIPSPAPANRFTPLVNDDVFTADVMVEVEKANKSILFETYLLNGKDGKALCDLLIKKKNEGLDVRVMLDPFMQKLESRMQKGDPLYQMGAYLRENGVECLEYPLKKLKGSLTPSEHAKVLIIDDTKAYLGGTNIDDTYNHDVNVKIEGPAAQDIRSLFEESWKVSSSPDPEETGYTSDPVITHGRNIKVSTTSPSRSTVKEAVLKNIRDAKESIMIEMFTLTDDDIEAALLAAKKRGVDVQVILCDNKEIFHLPTFHVPNLSAAIKFRKAGIPARWYVNEKFTQMHSKLCVFDHKKTMLGSANFIHNAFRGIHEYYGEIDDEELAKKMEAQFQDDWTHHGVDVEDPTMWQRMLGKVVEAIDGIIF
jgi:cardiolipin synthase A/B